MIRKPGQSEDSFRQAGYLAIGSAVAWWLQSVISIVLPDPTALLDLTMIVPLMLTLIALLALHWLGLLGTGKLKNVTVWILTIAAISAIPGQLSLALDFDSLKPVLVAVSAASFVGGLMLTGIALIRANLAPGWMGVALIIAQPLVMVIAFALSPISPLAESGDYSGAASHGIVWVLIGLSLLGKRLPLRGVSNPCKRATA